jgi:hypothetical protein
MHTFYSALSSTSHHIRLTADPFSLLAAASVSGPVGGTSAGAARDDSSLPAHGQEMTLKQGNQQHSQQSSSSDTHAASRPADNPAEIKGVVRKETLADAPQGADTA